VLPFREEIRDSLSAVLEVPRECVFLKGKTAEKLGFIGKGKAVEAHVVCLLEKN